MVSLGIINHLETLSIFTFKILRTAERFVSGWRSFSYRYTNHDTDSNYGQCVTLMIDFVLSFQLNCAIRLGYRQFTSNFVGYGWLH